MTTHLLKPGEETALCGLDALATDLKFDNNYTNDPYAVGCIPCRAFYERAVSTYWLQKIGYVPPSAKYSTIDISIPGVFLTLLRN